MRDTICLALGAFLLLCAHGASGQVNEGKQDKPQPLAPAPSGFDVKREVAERGKIETITYDSKSGGPKRKMVIYTPPGYTKDNKYPVLYLLHGIGEDETGWQKKASADIILDNLHADKKLIPMIVVMPNGRSTGEQPSGGKGAKVMEVFAAFEENLLQDIIPYVEAHYSVKAEREQRALAGLSMGGGQSLNFGLKNLDTFTWVGAFSSAPNTKSATSLVTDPASTAKKLRLLWVSCGDKDGLMNISASFHKVLQEKNVPHIWHIDAGAHTWQVWKNDLYLFSQLLFRDQPAPARLGTDDSAALERFHKEIKPLLANYCFDCHGDGLKKGGVELDQLTSADSLLKNRDLWWKVLKNVRGGLMPPAKQARPSADEIKQLERWIKHDALGLNPEDLDPGRVTLRRLNRTEYRNTINDLMGVDFKTDAEFPIDDTGYGFDNIGDVLSVSPLLLEKYMQAAKTIVDEAVPKVPKIVRGQTLTAGQFRGKDDKPPPDLHNFYKEGKYSTGFKIDRQGEYRFTVNMGTKTAFEYDPGRLQVVIKLDDREVGSEELYWANGKTFTFAIQEKLQPGDQRLEVELKPMTPANKKKFAIDLRFGSVRIEGPLDPKEWVPTKNYARFFTKDVSPTDSAERKQYAREVLANFTRKAFRRPADVHVLDRLTAIAESIYLRPEKTFEQGISQAMVAVLSSPRFLFRVEQADPADAGKTNAFIDDYSLASRLSYFLWSTMPDEELLSLAARGELRKNLPAQVQRMVRSPRSEALSNNFAGQWLQVRDVETMSFVPKTILKSEGITKKIDLDKDLRQAMRLETQMVFNHIFQDDRSVLEFLDSDYTFLNERLAQYYGIAEVKGPEMRRVDLPQDSHRGGVLTHAAVLMITSNPTRTSPVKRGLFVLDNILGTPSPPPPADVPQLEEAAKAFKGKEPTMRQLMELHRSQALCSACHSRMDPLGLGLENFNALGMWRDKENNQPIDVSGKLITGETFDGLGGLKKILMKERRSDFYRCLTEKLLTYALGRGTEYYDVATVDKIVEQLEQQEGRFSALLTGVVESVPFQKRRNINGAAVPNPPILNSSKLNP